MNTNDEKPGAGSGSFTPAGTGTRTGTFHGPRHTVPAGTLLDHEKLQVYCVARELLVHVNAILKRKMSAELRDQLDRASMSILFNIGEGAGKTAKADKQRSYEIARGSTMETATQLDVLSIRGLITPEQYSHGRELLVRIGQMLSKLCGDPRSRKP
jgi:four helix bundle protein